MTLGVHIKGIKDMVKMTEVDIWTDPNLALEQKKFLHTTLDIDFGTLCFQKIGATYAVLVFIEFESNL